MIMVYNRRIELCNKSSQIALSIVVFIFYSVSFSCSSFGKQDPLRQLEELTEDIRLHHQEYTTADWKNAYARYEQIAAEMESYQYTKEEAARIGEMEGECVGYFMKSAINSLGGIESEIKGFVDGINKTME
jgi:hypothetical protein